MPNFFVHSLFFLALESLCLRKKAHINTHTQAIFCPNQKNQECVCARKIRPFRIRVLFFSKKESFLANFVKFFVSSFNNL